MPLFQSEEITQPFHFNHPSFRKYGCTCETASVFMQRIMLFMCETLYSKLKLLNSEELSLEMSTAFGHPSCRMKTFQKTTTTLANI